MEEIWKDIKGLNNYFVSNLGRVKFGDFIKSQNKTKTGYLRVYIGVNGKRKIFRVHRLVAEAFIPNPENKPCVDHINCVRDDNRLCNLRWVTHKENNNNPLSVENYRKAALKHRDTN